MLMKDREWPLLVIATIACICIGALSNSFLGFMWTFFVWVVFVIIYFIVIRLFPSPDGRSGKKPSSNHDFHIYYAKIREYAARIDYDKYSGPFLVIAISIIICAFVVLSKEPSAPAAALSIAAFLLFVGVLSQKSLKEDRLRKEAADYLWRVKYQARLDKENRLEEIRQDKINRLEKARQDKINKAIYANAVYSHSKTERNKVTPKLRYRIIQRDGYRCVLCGRSAYYDGVKLHVDHIFPVSKGGLTVDGNLRTLCADCNLGKGDSYP